MHHDDQMSDELRARRAVVFRAQRAAALNAAKEARLLREDLMAGRAPLELHEPANPVLEWVAWAVGLTLIRVFGGDIAAWLGAPSALTDGLLGFVVGAIAGALGTPANLKTFDDRVERGFVLGCVTAVIMFLVGLL
jgi:hypothetical protein